MGLRDTTSRHRFPLNPVQKRGSEAVRRQALTDAKIRNAKHGAKRVRLLDTAGLYVEIAPQSSRRPLGLTEGKFWRYRYRIGGRENMFAAGKWCEAPLGEAEHDAKARRAAGRLTLAEARVERLQWRASVKAGQHPRLVRLAERLASIDTNASTFKAVAEEWIQEHGKEWSAAHRTRVLLFLNNYAYPDLALLTVASIKPAQLLVVLRRIVTRGALSMASHGQGYLGQIFRFAAATQRVESNPVDSLKGAISLPAREHHKPLGRDDIKPFFAAVALTRANRQTEIAVRLLLLTMVRTIELRCAPWSEVNLEAAEWRIPAARMKKRRHHIVPLSKQAVVLFGELRELTGNGLYLFPNTREPGRPMSPAAIDKVFRRAGYGGRFSRILSGALPRRCCVSRVSTTGQSSSSLPIATKTSRALRTITPS